MRAEVGVPCVLHVSAPRAHGVECLEHRGHPRRVERVAAGDRERAVEHERRQQVSVAGGERLRDERAVAVAVEVDVPRVQGAEHIREVVGDGGCSVVVSRAAHLLRAVVRGGDRVVTLLQGTAAQR